MNRLLWQGFGGCIAWGVLIDQGLRLHAPLLSLLGFVCLLIQIVGLVGTFIAHCQEASKPILIIRPTSKK